MFNYSAEEIQELYHSLPEDLKRASFSEKNTERVSSICKRYNLDNKKRDEVIRIVAHVLFGLLPPNNLAETLEKELKIDKDISQKIHTEVNVFIFSKVRDSLESLYDTKIIKEEEEETTVRKEDPYKEPIE